MSVSTQNQTGLTALPRLTTTVPKEYVHRASLAEVFLTGCTTQTQDSLRFSLTGQWPRAHTFFNSPDGSRHDPLQVAETFRQAGMFVSHAELGIPLGHHFVMWNLSYTTDLGQLGIGSTPTDFDVEVKCTDITRRRGALSQMWMEFSIHRDGLLLAHGGARFSLLTPAVYRRLRAGRLQPMPGPAPAARPVPPACVGRTSAADVVLSSTDRPGRWLLTPNFNHPIMFEHSADHVPGMVLLESARQAASALVAPRVLTPASASTAFYRYAEFDSPCWIDVTRVSPESGGMVTVEVTGHQDGEPVFTSTMTGPVA